MMVAHDMALSSLIECIYGKALHTAFQREKRARIRRALGADSRTVPSCPWAFSLLPNLRSNVAATATLAVTSAARPYFRAGSRTQRLCDSGSYLYWRARSLGERAPYEPWFGKQRESMAPLRYDNNVVADFEPLVKLLPSSAVASPLRSTLPLVDSWRFRAFHRDQSNYHPKCSKIGVQLDREEI